MPEFTHVEEVKYFPDKGSAMLISEGDVKKLEEIEALTIGGAFVETAHIGEAAVIVGFRRIGEVKCKVSEIGGKRVLVCAGEY